MNRVMLASGGSGGHLAPAIAISRVLSSRNIQNRILTTEKQVDQVMRNAHADCEFDGIPAVAFVGLRGLSVAFLKNWLVALCKTIWAMHQFQPKKVLATGGFGSIPPVVVGALFGKQVYIHESNSVSGRVTRWLGRLCQNVFVTRLLMHDESRLNYYLTGFPLRNLEYEGRKEATSAGAKTVLVLGGSQGATALNNWLSELKVADYEGIKFYGICGPLNQIPKASNVDVEWIRFVENMSSLYRKTDVVIARSGAGTIAELAHCRCPAILVPLPSSADDHQFENAKSFEQAGCSTTVEQNNLVRLEETLRDLLNSEHRREMMKCAQQEWDKGNKIDNLLKLFSEGLKECQV